MTRRLSLTLAALVLAACSGKEAKPNDSATAAPSATPNVVTITAQDFAFTLPDTIPAGVTTIRFINNGPNIHHAQIVRLEQGKTLADLMADMKKAKPTDPPPAYMMPAGGPNPPAPGEQVEITQTFEPGNYAVVCFVDIPDHVPHIMKGMSKALVVVPSTSTAAEPTADVTLTLTDYAFTPSVPLTAGKHTIRIDNTAQQPHEMFLARLDSGKTVKDFEKWAANFQGPPPVKPLGGVAFMLPGAHVFVPVDLTPGDYMMICFVPDAKDGKPHFMHGMVTQFKIT